MRSKSWWRTCAFILGVDLPLMCLGFLTAFPLLWLVVTSFKNPEDQAATILLPTDLSRLTTSGWETMASSGAGVWLVNSIILSGMITVGTVVVAALAGWGLARWPGKPARLVTGFLAATMMLPAQVLLPASYELMFHLGWLGSWLAIILPSLAGAFAIMLMRNAFAAIPGELIEAAQIDGASSWRIWWQVAMPCVRPMTSALTLMAFCAAWNAFLWPQIILADAQHMPLSVGIASLGASTVYQADFSPVMAGTVLAILPPMLLFAWLQRDFIAGLTQGAVKG